MASFAQELHSIYNEKKAELLGNREVNLARREKDVTAFFEQVLKEGAMEKMRVRAEAGRPTANILEYQPNERFYVDDAGDVHRFVSMEVNTPNYRIHDIVLRDKVFAELLERFEQEISSESNKITFAKWKPKENMHVVEAVWGRNKYHNSQRSFRNHSPRPFVHKSSEYIPIQRVNVSRRHPVVSA